MTSIGVTWLYRTLAVVFISYYIFCSVPSVECATSRTSGKCENVTTQIIVNETREEWCAGLSSVYCYITGTCYCNVTELVPKTHVTLVCEDGADNVQKGSSNIFRNLTDPEVASIAVISSLVISILLSVIVFFAQRRRRGCVARKNGNMQVVQVERGGADDGLKFDGPPAEAEAFLPVSEEKRYIHVQPANRELNLYEDVQGQRAATPDEKGELEMAAGKASVRYVAQPGKSQPRYAAATPIKSLSADTPSNRMSSDSSTQTDQRSSTALLETTSRKSTPSPAPSPSPVVAPPHSSGPVRAHSPVRESSPVRAHSPVREASPVRAPSPDRVPSPVRSASPTRSASPVESTACLTDADEEEPAVDSTSSLRLNSSEEHYENA